MMRLSILLSILVLSSCLKTRSDLGDNYQSEVYSQKQADNQVAASEGNAKAQVEAGQGNEEKDDLIRQLNGRIEVLENQISQLNKEKSENTDADKIKLLQDSLTKMETQIQQLESVAALKASEAKASEEKAQEALKEAQTAKDKYVPAKNSTDATEMGKVSSGTKTTKELSKNEKLKLPQANPTFEKAQTYFASKDFKNAILEYQKFVDEKPKSNLVPESKYKMGLCFEALGMKDEAYSFYEEVAAQYAKTEFGKKAKTKVSARASANKKKK